MLAIRLQRTGRKGHAMFRVVVQDSRRTPTSGKIVYQVGTYDPHTKAVTLKKDKAAFYVEHGAQPSPRVARLLQAEGVKLPEWVKLPEAGNRSTRHPEKLRKNQPKEEVAAETPVAAPTEAEEVTETKSAE